MFNMDMGTIAQARACVNTGRSDTCSMWTQGDHIYVALALIFLKSTSRTYNATVAVSVKAAGFNPEQYTDLGCKLGVLGGMDIAALWPLMDYLGRTLDANNSEQ